MNDIGLKLLSKSEKAILKGEKKGVQDLMAENSIMKSTLKTMLGFEVETELEDGTSIKGTTIDILVAATVADAIEKPSTSKLKDLTNILGELKENVSLETNISKVDEDLRSRAIED